MPESDRRTEIIVGLFLFFGLALLAVLIMQFGRFGDRFRHHYPLTLVVDDASGLIKDAEIRMGGAKIGRVADTPQLDNSLKIQIGMDIDDRVRIPDGSSFRISTASLLGDKLIIVTPPEVTGGKFYEAGSVIVGGAPSGLEAIQDNAEHVSRDARKMMKDAEVTLQKLDSAVDDIRVSTKELGDTMKKINTSVLSDANIKNIEGTIKNVEQTTATWAKASEELQPALASIREAAAKADTTFAKAGDRIDELKPAFERIPNAVGAIESAAQKAGNAIERAEKGEGLLGSLAYDRELNTDAKTFVRNLKNHGILRYRDKESDLSGENDPRNRFQGRRR